MLKKFFILCSGADRPLLNSCSDGEQNKYIGIGATVFFTALMAFIAGSYALFTVFDNLWMALGFGFVWGLLIFNLDRYIVSTMRKSNGFMNEFLQVLPRLALAIIIAIVIAKPLELKIFEKEINTVLLDKKNELALNQKKEITKFYETDLIKNQAKKDSLKAEITFKQKEVDALYDVFITEAEGTSGTKKLGKGPVYKEKRDKHDLALKQLDSIKAINVLKIKEIEKNQIEIEKNQLKKIEETQPTISQYNGLMARIEALGQLPALPSIFIMLLFLAVETAPILAKLISPRSEYDFKIENREMGLKNMLSQNAYQSDLQTKTVSQLNDQVYKDLHEENELINHKKKGIIDILKMQSDYFVNQQKKSFEG
jgi:hypothetical protein